MCCVQSTLGNKAGRQSLILITPLYYPVASAEKVFGRAVTGYTENKYL